MGYLSPGIVNDGSFSVIFGKNTDTRMNLTRIETVTSGGSTTLTGQDGRQGEGGDLYLRAGSGVGQTNDVGGVLHLMPGSSKSADAGGIVTIRGQDALDGTGGDLILVGGAGLTSGGDVHLSGGDGQNVGGGDFVLTGG